MNAALTNWALLLSLVFLWGSSFSLTKIAVTSIAPEMLVVLRVSIGSLVLFSLLLMRRGSLPRGRIWFYLAVVSVLGNLLPFHLIAWGQQFIPSGQAGVLMAVMPLIILGLAPLLLPDETVGLRGWVGFVLGFVGVALLMGPEAWKLSTESAALVGQFSVLMGAVCYALAAIVSRLRPKSGALSSAAGSMGLAAVFGSFYYFPQHGLAGITALPAITDPWVFISIGFLGVGATGVATWVYFYLISRAGASFLSLINYLIPAYAVIVGAAWLGEVPNTWELTGMATILLGLFLAQGSSRSST